MKQCFKKFVFIEMYRVCSEKLIFNNLTNSCLNDLRF